MSHLQFFGLTAILGGICFVISRNKCNKFVSFYMMQQHRLRIDLPNAAVGSKNGHKCMVSRGLHRHMMPCSPGTWRCTDETRQHSLFLHITYRALDQSRSCNSDHDITVKNNAMLPLGFLPLGNIAQLCGIIFQCCPWHWSIFVYCWHHISLSCIIFSLLSTRFHLPLLLCTQTQCLTTISNRLLCWDFLCLSLFVFSSLKLIFVLT